MSDVKFCPQCENRYDAELRFCPTDGATLRGSDASGDLVGAIVADRYLVLEQLGEGGMGRVYLAEHVRMGRRSALKVMHPGMVHDGDAIARFNREAANASRINHPNVAAIYDFGETGDGLIYLAMEYIEGEPLTAIVERQGALPPARAAAIAAQVADALVAAHEMGIVHRDLKPDNIMIARGRDGGDLVKVVDFGIAKSTRPDNVRQNVTRTGFIVGTPDYMSPEQLAGDPLDGRSDVYALGLVTFHMLTGVLPFPSATAQESMIMRLTERPRTLSEVRTGFPWPDALQAVLDRALAREAKHRYTDASSFRRDLLSAAEDMPERAVADAATAVMAPPASLPPTRVAAPTRTAAPTRAAPRAAGVRASRRRTPIVAAVVLLAMIGLAAGGYATTRRGLTLPGGDSSILAAADVGTRDSIAAGANETAAAPQRPSATAEERLVPPAGEPAPGSDATDASRTTSPVRTVGSNGAAGPAPFDPRAALDALREHLATISEERGRTGLTMVDALLPRITSRADSIEALYRRAEAYAMLERQPELCATLATISGPADLALITTGLRAQITALRDNAFCTPPGS